MKVNLKRNWFGPDDKRWRQRDNPHDMPADYKEILPKDAVVLDDEPKKEAEAKDAKKQEKKPSPAAPDALTL